MKLYFSLTSKQLALIDQSKTKPGEGGDEVMDSESVRFLIFF